MVAVSLKKNFFKQKTAYEISLGLVGSEMCIRDSPAECRAVAAVCGGEVLRDVPFETFLAKLPECRRPVSYTHLTLPTN